MTGLRKQVFVGTFISSKSPNELNYLHDALVCVDGEGRIVKVDNECGSASEVEKRLLKTLGWKLSEVDIHVAQPGQFFFPGFIDSHIHAPQYPNVGIFGKTTLLDWLEKYTFPLESSLKDLAKARRVYTSCVRRTLANGTTTAAYFATIDVQATNLLADLCLELGQRAFVGRVCMDNPDICPDHYRDESAAEGLDKTMQTIRHVQDIDPEFKLVSPILTPRFAPSCSSESMHGLARIQKEMDLPVQTHISENDGEIALVAQMFPDSGSYANMYDDHGLLTSRTILAHAIHLSEAEAQLVAKRGSKVSHCPCSNSSLTSGAARVRWMWDKGITVGLGTDMSGGYSPSILEAARQAALVSRHVAMGLDAADPDKERSKLTVEEVLHLATRGGAEVVGLQGRVGGFEEGMEWDAQLIGLGSVDDEGVSDSDGNVDVFGWETWEERVAKWLFNGDDRNVKKVWVKGRMVHARK
ncbi:guanine deaminase [Fusarium albosuccineum]|uniref:Guanine deaminase n=1 Tax=Fusarium albosuccineum TaxID=1237068 RepID=A0A8H4LP03_9HYPO|nr:guanine deaminase [Fusarium albosuccineum]